MPTIFVDITDAEYKLLQLNESQIPYAISLGINRLANKVQEQIREGIKGNFKLRRSSFVLQGIYISKENRASKTDWSVTIEVQDARGFLNKFEQGGDHVSFGGRKYLTVPNKKVFGNRIISSDDPLKVKNLHLQHTRYGLQGQQGTFLIKSAKTGIPMILQRVAKDAKGKGRRGNNRKTGCRMLYTLVEKVKVPAKLHFIQTATNVVGNEFAPIMSKAIEDAIKSAR